jgi:hypothetical protein
LAENFKKSRKMLDESTRSRVQNAENKRLYREALKKKLNAQNMQAEGSPDEEQIKLPSFAITNRLGMLECAICGEEHTSRIEFINHLNKPRHLKAIEKIKKQV